MTSNDSMFTSLEDSGDNEQVTFGDNSKGKVIGLGKIAISNDLSISNVFFVKSLIFNLLSIAQLCDLGLTCVFDEDGVVVTSKKDKSLIFQGFRHGHLYLVDFSAMKTRCNNMPLLQVKHGLALAPKDCSYRHEPTQESIQKRHGD